MTNLDLSVVFPVFNEKENVPVLLGEIRQALEGHEWNYEIIAVDDGSTDGSDVVLREAAAQFSTLRVLRFKANRGQTAALDAGWRAARGTYVVSLDADLQNDPADIPAMMRLIRERGVDMVAGVRVNRRDTAWKRFQSKIGNGVRNWITGDQVTDTGCSLKILRRTCIDDVRLYRGMHRFLPTLLRIEGYVVIEMPVNHRPRRFGTTKYGAWNRAFQGLADCFAVRWMKQRHLDYEILEEER